MNNEITILQTSDVHGTILPINYADNKHINKGLCKLSQIIKKERQKNPEMILIDNGDMLQGTALTYYHAKIGSSLLNPAVSVMNYLKYDAAVIGNHEFNYGQKYLKKAFSESLFPWLSANILIKENNMPFSGKPYVIKNLSNGIKVAILGITTKCIPNWEDPDEIFNLSFEDAVESAQKWVHILKSEKGADVIVVSYHGGFERDFKTRMPTENLTGENQAFEILNTVKGIDVLLTGHQHRLVENEEINGVITVQPGANGECISKVSLKLKKHCKKWTILKKESKLLYAKKCKCDNNISFLLKDIEFKTQKWLDTPIGTVSGDMAIKDHLKCRLKDNAFVEFINKVQMSISGASISATPIFNYECKGFNSKITIRDIMSNYIYPNSLKVIQVKGIDIKNALEKSADYFIIKDNKISLNYDNNAEPKIRPYNYDMWEGIEYIINVSMPIGCRVTKLLKDGSPLQMDKDYHIVVNSYRAGGGGNYLMYKNKPVIREIPIDMPEIIANYILNKKNIKACINNNWKVIH